jgi:phosphoserine phosphatase
MRELKPKDLSKLLDTVKAALDKGAHPIAAFDADGTLWDTDLGENFFKFQIKEKLVDLPANAWEHYQQWHQDDPVPAYVWLAQINKGHPLSTVRGWAKQAVSAHKKVPVFSHMVELIAALKKLKVKVYIVTASVKWAIEPAAELVGLTQDDVLGIKTRVHQGLVTDEQDGPVTWREGKVTGLLEATGGKSPLLAAGNTTGDLFLLQAATDVPLAHTLAGPTASYYVSEQDLLKEAQKRNWYRVSAR